METLVDRPDDQVFSLEVIPLGHRSDAGWEVFGNRHGFNRHDTLHLGLTGLVLENDVEHRPADVAQKSVLPIRSDGSVEVSTFQNLLTLSLPRHEIGDDVHPPTHLSSNTVTANVETRHVMHPGFLLFVVRNSNTQFS